MRDHRKLLAFKKADSLAVMMYKATADFPSEERFGLTAQLRRAAVSVPSNIVEGAARDSDADYLRFLDIAFGSLKEMRYQWSLAQRLSFVSDERFEFVDAHLEESVKTLAGLIKKNRRRVRRS
jgi:four helix bundle protein